MSAPDVPPSWRGQIAASAAANSSAHAVVGDELEQRLDARVLGGRDPHRCARLLVHDQAGDHQRRVAQARAAEGLDERLNPLVDAHMAEQEKDEGVVREAQLGPHLGSRASLRVGPHVGAVGHDGHPLSGGAELLPGERGRLGVVGEQHVAGACQQAAADPVEPPARGLERIDLVDRPGQAVAERPRAPEAQREQAHLRPRGRALRARRVAIVVLGPVEVQHAHRAPVSHQPAELEHGALAHLEPVGLESVIEQPLVRVLGQRVWKRDEPEPVLAR